MDVTREHISRILELREMLLSFQTGFNLVNAAVVCIILGSISSMEPSPDRMLEACDCLKLLSIYLLTAHARKHMKLIVCGQVSGSLIANFGADYH